MTAAALQSLVRQLRLTTASAACERPSDAELLERLSAGDDPQAFEAIVRRHGAGVLASCRKVLPSEADVEDAFQATFLILLRSARTIRQRQSLGGWLCGVAHRVALKALAGIARRQRLEQRKLPEAAEAPDLSWREACAILHEELDRLPDKYRLPLILCYLEGRSRDEAAQQLAVSTDVLRGRLERARDRLRGRLLRRGITLSAGLLAALGTGSVTAGGPPEQLIRATREAATGGTLSPSVATLLHGATSSMTPGTFKCLIGAVLAAGLLFGTVALSMPESPPSRPLEPRASAAAPASGVKEAAPVAKEREKESLELAGRVLDPDGRPVAGSRLYVTGSKRSDHRPLATTDAAGQFRLTMKPAEVGTDGRLLAGAEGHAPDWVDLSRCGPGEVVLRLRKDDVPLTGRVINLEGQPVAGATLEVARLGKQEQGEDLKSWIDHNVEQRRRNVWVNERGLLTVALSALGQPLSATTGPDGRFRLSGAGRDRVLSVRVRGKGVEHKYFWAVTRPDAPKDGYIRTREFSYGLYGPEVTVLVAPSRPIQGTVRDRVTGKPVAGVLVEEVNNNHVQAFTDAKGQYRLEGVPKRPSYSLTAAGKKGIPYFDCHIRRVTDTAGFDPLTVDFQIDRGLEITGRIRETGTGKPVRGEVHYSPMYRNPRLKDYPSLSEGGVIISNWGKVQPDGTFTVLAIPGPGALAVCAGDVDRYPILDADRELGKMKIQGYPVDPVHAIVAVDADEKQPASLVHEFELYPGKTRTGRVVGPDVQPLDGIRVAGLAAVEGPEQMKSPAFTLTGLSNRQRLLVFYHAEKKLGAVFEVRADTPEPLVVKLQPLGSVEGRVIDTEGEPCAGLEVTLRAVASRLESYENLPLEYVTFQGVHNIQHALWSGFTGRKTTTDKDGRFRLEGVFPGLRYQLYASDGDVRKARTLVAQRQGIRVEAGGKKDVGAVKKGEGMRED
jgi:RNA polymerase sigma factor (sigma-70 family)